MITLPANDLSPSLLEFITQQQELIARQQEQIAQQQEQIVQLQGVCDLNNVKKNDYTGMVV